jgi:hypothetical protein
LTILICSGFAKVRFTVGRLFLQRETVPATPAHPPPPAKGRRRPPRPLRTDLIALSRLDSEADEAQLRTLLEEHAAHTGSLRAKALLADWPAARAAFWKVAPS